MSAHEDEKERLIIESVRTDGQRFRPSDWIERISSVLASFGDDHRLRYAECVQPSIIDGQKCLVVRRDLEEKNPQAYHFIMSFAEDNDLRIQIDRRREPRPVNEERRNCKLGGAY